MTVSTLSRGFSQFRQYTLTRWGLRLLPYALALYIAEIFLRYLPFKFSTGRNPIFSTLETWSGLEWVEPHGRFFTGGVELLAVVLLFIPGLQVAGALLAFGVMGGAIASHLFTSLGIDPFNDGGKLFKEAVTVWLFAGVILGLRRREILPFLRALVIDPNFRR